MESCLCYRDSTILETLKKFQPLIKKYARKLDYDGAENWNAAKPFPVLFVIVFSAHKLYLFTLFWYS